MMKLIFLFLIWPAGVFAANPVCLRHPDFLFENFKVNRPPCSDLETLWTSLVDSELDQALVRATKSIERNPVRSEKIWRAFWEQIKKQIWGPKHGMVAQEIRNRLGIESQNSDRVLNLEFQSLPGWEDGVLVRDGNPVHDEKSYDSQESHWVGFSSVYAPVVFYGSWREFRKKLSDRNAKTWIERDCGKSTVIDDRLKRLSIPTKNFLVKACRDFKPDLIPMRVASGETFPLKPLNFISGKRNLFWGAVGLAVLSGVAHSLKDKKVVIRR